MAFNNVVSLISGGTTYYLSGSTNTNYTGSGTPWTAENTTPYRMSWNDGSPIWVPQPSLVQMIYGGGPPFSSVRRPLYRSYDQLTEPIGIQMYANSADNAIFLLNQLRQILNIALYSVPCMLVVQGGTNTGYAEILSADVVETNSYQFLGNTSTHEIRATISWTRTAFFGTASLTTLFTNTTFTNNGASNTASLGATAGDLLYEGQPLNLKIDGPAASVTGVNKIWLSTCKSRAKTTHTLTASTTTSTSAAASGTITATSLLTNNGINLAVFFRFSSITAGNKALIKIDVAVGGTAATSAWQTPPVTSGTTMMYMGMFNLARLRVPIATSIPLTYVVSLKSIDGTSVGYTLDYSESVFAYTVAEVTGRGSVAGYGNGSAVLYSTRAQNLNGTAWLPVQTPIAYSATSGDDTLPDNLETVRGVLPLAYSGASLWAAWIDGTNNHTSTDTLRITANHLPLYRTLRGGG